MEAMSDLINTSKDCGGNPGASALHPQLDDNVENVYVAIGDLRSTLQMSPESGLSSSFIEKILKSREELDVPVEEQEIATIMEQHELILNSARAIARASQDMVGKASINPDCLSKLSQVLLKFTFSPQLNPK